MLADSSSNTLTVKVVKTRMRSIILGIRNAAILLRIEKDTCDAGHMCLFHFTHRFSEISTFPHSAMSYFSGTASSMSFMTVTAPPRICIRSAFRQ